MTTMVNDVILSILIPTFNYSCVELVKQLNQQITALGISCEIIVADDASTDMSCRLSNNEISLLPHCTYIEQNENMGRAGIRNFLASCAKGQWLLFLDCDAQVISSHFLADYLHASNQASVICGGLVHPSEQPSPEVSLRYRYERDADKRRAAHYRSLHPYDHFTTFCFLIDKEVFSSILFNEHCHEYGHEDTLFGEELKNKGIAILHIDNPLMHIGLEDNASFLKKTETALHTLHHLEKKGIILHSRLVQKYQSLHRYGLHSLLPIFHKLVSPVLRWNLLGKNPSLTCFAIYKLGYYATLKSHKQG